MLKNVKYWCYNINIGLIIRIYSAVFFYNNSLLCHIKKQQDRMYNIVFETRRNVNLAIC